MEQDETQLLPDENLNFLSKWASESNLETLRSHVLKIWEICKKNYHTYVCIERLMFLNPRLIKNFGYKSLLDVIKPTEGKPAPKVADIGCCFGQDIRQLILEGISTKSIYAIDLHDGYWNAGREFFMDNLVHSSTRLDGITTVFGDFAVPYPLPEEATDRIVDSLKGNFEAVICQMVYHVLSKEQAENLTKRMFSMLKPGGVLIGSCVAVACEDATSWAPTPRGEGVRLLQSSKSLNELLSLNDFVDIEIRQAETGANWKKVPLPIELAKPDVKKCRLEFLAYKKK